MKKIWIGFGAAGFYLLATTLTVAFDIGFFFFPLIYILTVPICVVMLVCGVVFCVRHWKRYRWKGLLPLLIPMVMAGIWLSTPAISRYLEKASLPARMEAAELVLEAYPDSRKIPEEYGYMGYDGVKAYLPERYQHLSLKGEVLVIVEEGDSPVFFNVTKGILADTVWIVYTTDREAMASLEITGRTRHIEGPWYFVEEYDFWEERRRARP